MPFSHIPTRPEGRAVHIAAYELAIEQFNETYPGALTDRHLDAMVEAISEKIASGTTHIVIVAQCAIAKARALESVDA